MTGDRCRPLVLVPGACLGGWAWHEVAALPTGHWPMFSLPGPLAELLHRIAADRADASPTPPA